MKTLTLEENSFLAAYKAGRRKLIDGYLRLLFVGKALIEDNPLRSRSSLLRRYA